MSIRERGAAHINIYYFLVLLLLFFGAVGWAYVEMTQKNEAREEAKTAQEDSAEAINKFTVAQAAIEDIVKVTGEGGTYNPPSRLADPSSLPSLEKVPDAKKIENHMTSLGRKLGLPATNTKPVSALVAAVADKFDALQREVAAAEQAKQVANTKATTADTTFKADLATKDSQYSKNVRAAQNRANQMQAEKTRQEGKTQTVRNQLRSTEEELNTTKEQHRKIVVAKDKAINKREMQLEHMVGKIRMINKPADVDGKVVSASMGARKAWIDLGRKDMLQRGTRFRISAPRSRLNPDPIVKAIGTVIAVENNRATLRLTNVVNGKFDPIVAGDVISNDLYTPGLKRNIVLLGRFPLTSPKPTVKTLLERLGNKVFDKVGPGVDLVVAGSAEYNDAGEAVAITEHPGYKKAEDLRIEIIALNKIRDLIKVAE